MVRSRTGFFDEGSPHEAPLTKPFYMAMTELTEVQ